MDTSEEIEKLKSKIDQLTLENENLRKRVAFHHIDGTVIVPEQFKEIFEQAEKNVRSYFSDAKRNPASGEITISGERYVLIRSASLSYEFMEVFKELYSNRTKEEAARIGNNFLFDIAHVIGREDAKAFHQKMNLKEAVQKLAAGPVHFAFTGWASVEILPESNPSPGQDFYLKFYHHNSFEAQSWINQEKKADAPVCIMNSGYSSGWCEESFGMPLTAVEIECEAHGGKRCAFIMAPPDRIKEYLDKETAFKKNSTYDVPVFFERKYTEDKLKDSLKQKEILLQEVHHRVKNNLQVISSLLNLQKQTIEDEFAKSEFDKSISRVNTIALVQDMIYGASDVSSINIEKFFSKLLKSLYTIYSGNEDSVKFVVEIDIEQVIFDPNLAIPLGLILNEIACNSFKYAFKNGGFFYLKMNQTDSGYTLIAGDNGPGISNINEEGSLGMSLISILCEQIEAELVINNSDKGLEYVIAF